jgi:dTDP-4-dehydrorhamnose 3,5-epimerase
MDITKTDLEGVLIIRPDVYPDERGTFMESWHSARYEEAGLPATFLQDNISVSSRGVVRGMHYQIPRPQGKLVTVLTGEIFDVAVDIRRDSPTFGHWTSAILSETNNLQMFVPVGFAHGFMALSDNARVLYKCTDIYEPGTGRTISVHDPDIGIDWPDLKPILSVADAAGVLLSQVPPDQLF